ncbi:MAG TPA: chemotaxis protein CheX [Rectinemataceae bacterium]|nr:chemotaxis protein CheX [Rectinemataceae bacterium]
MEQRLIEEAFIASVRGTFKDMFGLEAAADGVREITGGEDHDWDLTGLIGLAGQTQGVVALRLTRALAGELLAGSGVEASHDEERRQLESGIVGEISNIIAGAATASMDAEIAPPVIISGPRHKIGWPNIAPVVALSFSLPDSAFEVDLCLKGR